MSVLDQKTSYDSDKESGRSLSGSDLDDLEKNAEIDDLNKQFNAPAIADEDRNTSKSPEEQEEEQLQQASDDEGSKENSDWDTDINPAQRNRRILRRRVAVVAGVSGFSIGAIFGVSVFLSGPLQFIHLAQMMQNFHMFQNEESSDGRLTKIARFLQYRDTPEKMRLGKVGNAIADKTTARLNNKGFNPVYDGAGYLTGYDVDGAKYASTHNIDNTPASIESHVRQNLNADLTINGDKLTIDTSDMGFFKNRKLASNMVKGMGYNRVSGAMRTRLMTKRSGAPLNPLKSIDKKVKQDFNEWRKNRAQTNSDGVEQKVQTGDAEDVDTDGDGTVDAEDPDAAAHKAQTDEVIGEASAEGEKIRTGSVDVDAPSPLKTRISSGLKVGGAVTAVVGVSCLAKGIADNVDELKHANVILPLMRIGVEMVAVGNEVMAGEGVDWQVLGYYNKMLNDPANKSIWSGAQSIRAETGQTLTGPDIREEARIDKEKNVVLNFVQSIPGLDGVCGVANSLAGQVATFAIDFASGPISAVIGTAAAVFAGPYLIDALSNWLAGSPINVNVLGADLGNFVNYGNRLAAASSGMLAGGTMMGTTASMEWKEHRLAVEKEELQNMSIAQRIFNPFDYRTVAGRMVDSANPDVSTNVAAIVSSPIKSFGSIAGTIKSAFVPRVSAQTASSYDYGFSMYGFTIDELENPAVDNPFDNARVVNDILSGPSGESLKDRAKICFGTTFDSNNNPLSADETGVPKMYVIEENREVDGVTPNCSDKSEEWLRLRMYIFDTQIGDTVTCYEGDESSCAEIGLDLQDTGDSEGSTAGNPNIYVIGDSLTVGMRDSGGLEGKLTEKGWKVVNSPITAVGGKPLSWGIEQVKSAPELTAETGTVLVNLGTNDGATSAETFASQVDEMVAEIKKKSPNAKIYWTNLYGEGTFCGLSCVDFATKFGELNRVLEDKAEQHSLTIISWSDSPIASEHVPDNDVHPYTGYPQMAEFIVSALGSPPQNGIGLTGDGYAFPLRANKSQISNRSMFKEGSSDKGGHPYTAFDILVAPGTEVLAFTKGRVSKVGTDKCPGRSIGITSEEQNITVTYMHLDFADHISEGTTVNPGDRIGKVGPPPNGCGVAHLHIDAVNGKTRPACKRESCPPENASKFVDIGKQLSDAFKEIPE